MTSIRLQKSWRVTTAYLRRAASALPEFPGDELERCSYLFSEYEQYLEHNEFELALDMLEELGAMLPCRGGYWRELERAAENMGLSERVPALREEFSEAVRRHARNAGDS